MGSSKFKNQIEWGTNGYENFDFAHIYLQAGEIRKSLTELEKCFLVFSKDKRDWSLDIERQCLQLKKIIQSGREAIETYLFEKGKKSKGNLKLENWLTADIYIKINELFADPEREKAEIILESLLTDHRLNVSPLQLARSILVLTKGNITDLKRVIDSNYYGDPRDVIMAAVTKSADNLEYFCKPFPY